MALPAPRWKADPNHETYDEIRARIVGAALRILITEGKPHLHMGELAAASGLARATLYRYFGDKEELVAAVYVRCVESLAEEFRREIRRFDDPAEQLVEGLLTMVAYVRGHSTVRSEFAPGAHDERMRAMSLRSRGEMARALVKPILDVLPLRFDDEDHERRVALWLRGILISLVVGALSEIESVEETRTILRQFVVPSLGLVAQAQGSRSKAARRAGRRRPGAALRAVGPAGAPSNHASVPRVGGTERKRRSMAAPGKDDR